MCDRPIRPFLLQGDAVSANDVGFEQGTSEHIKTGGKNDHVEFMQLDRSADAFRREFNNR